MDRYQHEMEAKYVSQPKPEMTWHPRSIPAGHSETRELRNNVNSMRSRLNSHTCLCYYKVSAHAPQTKLQMGFVIICLGHTIYFVSIASGRSIDE